ncbi:MAG: hypothetical protein HC843_08465 [Sphingomonadales bacterium]|nr:hypothetical protein [Sphingomonadales bacterium]
MTQHLPKAPIIFCALSLLLGGCATSDAFRSSVSEFGALTSTATATQNASLNIIIADEEERLAAQLAASRAELLLSVPDCLPPDAGGTPPCKLIRRDGKPLEEAARFAHIIALGEALEDYAANLELLASDAAEDKAAFKDAVGNAASSLAGLDSAIRDAAKIEKDDNVETKLGAVGSIAASLGILFLETKRAAALKAMIIKADPLVQQASAQLQTAYSIDRLYKQTGLLRTVQAKQNAARGITSDPASSTSDVRAAQTELFEIVKEFNEAAKGENRFAAIGRAHGDLARAAQAGASKKNLLAAAKSLFELAQLIGEELPKLKDQKGEQ